MSRAQDGHTESNISATTSSFRLDGGRYGAEFTATWGGGSVTLQKLGPDGSTYVTAMNAWTANGTALGDLPMGDYRLAVATATAVYVRLRRVPIAE